MNIKSCPHCGSTTAGFYRKVRAFGWCTELYEPNGQRDMIETTDLGFTPTKTFRCDECHKIRKDIVLVGRKVIVKE